MSALEGITSRMTNGTYQITRSAPGAYDLRGVWQTGATSAFGLTCAIFPGAAAELVPFLDGRRVEDVITIYSETPLFSSASGPDHVTYAGLTYAVFSVQTYAARGATLYVALAAKETIP